MATSSPGEAALKKLQDYVNTIKNKEYNLNAQRSTQPHEVGLEKTFKELTEHVNREQVKLDTVT